MIDFGYGLTPSATLKIENVQNPLFEELHHREPDVSKCIACGSCTYICPAKRPLTQMFKQTKAEIMARKRAAAAGGNK